MASSEPHPLEIEFSLSAREILDVILRRNRCHINVRGAVAEYHLFRLLTSYRNDGLIDDFEDFDRNGYPDLAVPYRGRTFLIECKNVEKAKSESSRFTVDFQRTRNPIGRPQYRFYTPDEFHILAACLWNRTGRWEFAYVATVDLPRHSSYPDRLSNRVAIPIENGRIVTPWSTNLLDILHRLST